MCSSVGAAVPKGRDQNAGDHRVLDRNRYDQAETKTEGKANKRNRLQNSEHTWKIILNHLKLVMLIYFGGFKFYSHLFG